jgi:hypothetical protein
LVSTTIFEGEASDLASDPARSDESDGHRHGGQAYRRT